MLHRFRRPERPASSPARDSDAELLGDALDTLAALLRTYGRYGSDAEDVDPAELERRCEGWARHVLTGAALEETRNVEPPTRAWSALRHFFLQVRRRERGSVHQTLRTLRDVLWRFADSLREALAEEEDADRGIGDRLERLVRAAERGTPDELQSAAREVAVEIEELLTERRERNRHRLSELGRRLREVRVELQEARRQAETDPLTGLPNRAALRRRLDSSVTLAAYTGQPEALLLLDLDHFKSLNDGHGHPAGDAVLRGVGEALARAVIRRLDFVARWGGEEFAVVLSDTDAAAAEAVAGRLLRELRELRIPHGSNTLLVTASIGVAVLREGRTAEEWVEEADRALYEAKGAGRDRYVRAA